LEFDRRGLFFMQKLRKNATLKRANRLLAGLNRVRYTHALRFGTSPRVQTAPHRPSSVEGENRGETGRKKRVFHVRVVACDAVT
jgi:hypothetical protein